MYIDNLTIAGILSVVAIVAFLIGSLRREAADKPCRRSDAQTETC